MNREELAARKRRYPLRKVVNEFASREEVVGGHVVSYSAFELECGHKLAPPEDMIGRRYPSRMRCRFCFAAESTPTKES
jgi:hypothetical protein